MLLSIILATALLFVAVAIGDSYAAAQRKMARGMAGAATLSIKKQGENDWSIKEEVPKLIEIKNTVGIINSPALFEQDGAYENFDLIGTDIQELNKINRPRLVDNSQLQEIQENEIVLPEKFTSKYGIQAGNDINLQIGEQVITFKVKAIAAYDTVFLRHTRGFNGLVAKERLQALLAAGDGFSEILIQPQQDIATPALKEALISKIDASYKVLTIVDEQGIRTLAREKSIPFLLIAFFALIMSIFIIYSSYKVITMERLHVIGTFRSIGATQSIITGILMMESLVYGILGSSLGILLGLVVLKVILEGLGKSLQQGINIPMIVSAINTIGVVLIIILVSILSAYLPIKKVSKLSLKELVLGRVEEKQISSKVKAGIGISLFGLSILLPHLVKGKLLYVFGGASLVGMIMGAIILVPVLTNLLAALLECIYNVLFKNEGRIAARNLKDNKNIHQNIILLFISISAVIAISFIGSFVNTYIGDVFKDGTLDGFADAKMSKSFIHKIEQIEGIKEVLPIYAMSNAVSMNGKVLNRLEATNNLKLYDEMLGVKYENEELKRKVEMYFNAGRNILINAEVLNKRGLKIGDTINLQLNEETYEYKIIGSFNVRATNADVIIPAKCAEYDFKVDSYDMMMYQAEDSEKAMSQIRNLFGRKENWSRTVKAFNEEALIAVGSFLKPMNQMTYLILCLAAIGVMNNLLINYLQRKRSIAMYKSLGMSKIQHIKITMLEGVSAGALGAGMGIVVSWLEIKTILIVAGPKIAIAPQLSVSSFIGAGIMGIVITLLGSIIPILRGNHMAVIAEIKYE